MLMILILLAFCRYLAKRAGDAMPGDCKPVGPTGSHDVGPIAGIQGMGPQLMLACSLQAGPQLMLMMLSRMRVTGQIGNGAAADADDVGHLLAVCLQAGPQLMLMMLARLPVSKERAAADADDMARFLAFASRPTTELMLMMQSRLPVSRERGRS